jgi:hypothetical protein
MILEFKVIIVTYEDKSLQREDTKRYEHIGKISFCCSKLKEVWNDLFFIEASAVLINQYYYYSKDDIINFCPFCGEKIESIVTKKIKQTVPKHIEYIEEVIE